MRELARAEEFEGFRSLFHERIGLNLTATKAHMLSARLYPRLQALGLSSYGDYRAIIERDPEEFQIATDFITTHETSFFREPRHFGLLASTVLPSLEEYPLRIWSAACSTGEEAWTLAMVLARHAREREWTILASDVSLRDLQTAEAARYTMKQSQGIDLTYLKACALRGIGENEGLFTFQAALRERVVFRQLNLLRVPPRLGLFSVIFLRNALIYFDQETKLRVLGEMCRHLKPGGWLFLGQSEALVGMDLPLRVCGPSVYRLTE